MISILHGTLISNDGQNAVIDCGGIGYDIHIPSSVSRSLPCIGETCSLFTILNISKTDVSLIGFSSKEQRSCFQMLTNVSGAGTKAGLEILGTLDVQAIHNAIIIEDAKAFTQVKGIGKKLAQRIILECHDKVKYSAMPNISFNDTEIDSEVLTAIDALVSLSYKKKEAADAVSGIDPTLPVEAIISQALKKLAL